MTDQQTDVPLFDRPHSSPVSGRLDIDGRPLRPGIWALIFSAAAVLLGSSALGLYGAEHIHTTTDRLLVSGGSMVCTLLAISACLRALLLRGIVLSISDEGFLDRRISANRIPWRAVKTLEVYWGGVVIILTEAFEGVSDLTRGAWNNAFSLSYLVRQVLPSSGYVVAARGLRISPTKLTEAMNAHRDAALRAMTVDERRDLVPKRDDPTADILLNLKGRRPYFSFGLLAVLVLIFGVELLLAHADGTAGRYPGDLTPISLVLDGGIIGNLINAGQLWRFFTAPLLHIDPLHLLGNGVALIFAGYLLERLLGWRLYGTIFAVSALTGGLASYAIDPTNVVSVGASGGIVGLFAASVVIAFHYPSGALRNAMIAGALRILIPTLLPFGSHHSGPPIDVAGHVGGALGGMLAGLGILGLWANHTEIKQRLVPAVMTVSFAAMAIVAFGFAAISREEFLSLDPHLPKDFKQRLAQSSELIKAYPRDPRIRYARAAALYNDDHNEEARTILDRILSDRAWLVFLPEVEVLSRKLLSQIDDDAGHAEDARADLAPLCHSPALSSLQRSSYCK